MKKSVGGIDIIIRVLVAVVIGVLAFTHVITGTLAIILGIVAIALLLTSLFGFCGLYTLLGINTCRVKQGKTSQ